MKKKLLLKTKACVLWLTLFATILFVSACDSDDAPTILIDTSPPSLVEVSPKSPLNKDISEEIVFSFSEDVTGFTTNDIKISGIIISKGDFIENTKKEYIWKITPKQDGSLKIEVSSDSFTDLSGNFNVKNYSYEFKVNETTPPNLSISTRYPLSKDITGGITFTFDEDVDGFGTNDIELSGIDVDKEIFTSPINKRQYEWKITPRSVGELIVNVPIGAFEDRFNNFNTKAFSNKFLINDITPPKVDVFSLYLTENKEGKIIFTFNEDVTNFKKEDIKFEGVTVPPEIGEFKANNEKSYEVKITPKAMETLTLKIDAGSLEDLFGNSNKAISTDLTVYTLTTENSLKTIIDNGKIPEDRSALQGIAKDVASYYTSVSSPEVVARYIKVDGTGDGSSWANATNDVKSTINSIEDASDSKVYLVLVASGKHLSSKIAMKNNVAIIGGWNPSEDWGRSGVTRFDGQSRSRVFNNEDNGLNHTALLYSATIANGILDPSFTSDVNGGGMYNENSSPSLEKVTFSKNYADDSGGGMYNLNSSPKLVDVSFLGNTSFSGGGMHNNNSSPSLEEVTFSKNSAGSGGGMFNWNSSSPTLKRVTFLENGASSSGGGGMLNNNKSSPILVDVTFSGNTTEKLGGGMFNYDNSSPTLNKVTFSKNRAKKNGGGIYNWDSSSPTLVNVTFSENRATTSGGGIYNYENSSPSLVNVTFSGNTAGESGGGIHIDGTLDDSSLLVNTIFWGNLTNGSANQVSFENTTDKLSLHYSIIQGGTNNLDGTLSSSYSIGDNPLLSPLADNGGLVQTYALGAGSPAINAGVYVKKSGDTLYFSTNQTAWYTDFDNQGFSGTETTTGSLPSDTEDINITDARGYIRLDQPDIGAFEYGATAD